MKRLLFVFLVLLYAGSCLAQNKDDLSASVSNIDEKEAKEEQVSVNTVSKNDEDIVKRALQVYKNKSKNGEETSVVIENSDGTKTLIIGKSYNSSDNALVFSPDGSKAFYMGVSTDGIKTVYGIDFSTSRTYSIGGASKFSLADCPNKGSYIVITKDDEDTGDYFIYDTEGNSIDTITYTGDIEDISDVICY